MTNKPHWIVNPKDSSSLDFRMDCMAWHMYTTMPAVELQQFVAERKQLQTPEFTNRLRRCVAWYWLAYLNRWQIVDNLGLLASDEEVVMREHLNVMRAEIKKVRQIEFKTNPRGKSHV